MRKPERMPSEHARPRGGVAEISELARKLSVTDYRHLHFGLLLLFIFPILAALIALLIIFLL